MPERAERRQQERAARLQAKVQEVSGGPAVTGFPGEPAAPVAIPAEWRSRLLAIGFGLDPDPARAAALVGLKASPAELAELAEDARRHRDLSERKPGAIGAYLATAIGLGAVRLASAMALGEISVDRTPAALRALVQALEGVQGSTQPAYSEIRLVVRVPEGVDPETGEALAREPAKGPVLPAVPVKGAVA